MFTFAFVSFYFDKWNNILHKNLHAQHKSTLKAEVALGWFNNHKSHPQLLEGCIQPFSAD